MVSSALQNRFQLTSNHACRRILFWDQEPLHKELIDITLPEFIKKFNTGNNSTTIADATINPSTSNTSFDVPAAGQYLISPDENLTADCEYYLPELILRIRIVLSCFNRFITGQSAQYQNLGILVNYWWEA